MNPFGRFSVVAICLTLLVGCRPPIGGEPGQSASSITGDLKPSAEMTVRLHLPLVSDALAGPIVNASVRDVVGSAGVRLEIVTPFSAYDAFQTQPETGVVDIFLATPGAAAVGRSNGTDLVMIAGLQRKAGFLLVTPSTESVSLDQIGQGLILVQGRPGDQTGLLKMLDGQGVDRSGVEFVFQDPVVPLDAATLFDGTYTAMLLTSYDGYARVQEYIDPESGIAVGPAATVVLAGVENDAIADGLGLGLWVQRQELEVKDKATALAVALIAIADGLANCRDDASSCASILNESALLDRYGEGVLWSVNELNKTIWPAIGDSAFGALSVNEDKLRDEITQAVSVGVVDTNSATDNLYDTRILDLMRDHIPLGLDLFGSDWIPIEVPLTIE